jgi:hypothetical protein
MNIITMDNIKNYIRIRLSNSINPPIIKTRSSNTKEVLYTTLRSELSWEEDVRTVTINPEIARINGLQEGDIIKYNGSFSNISLDPSQPKQFTKYTLNSELQSPQLNDEFLRLREENLRLREEILKLKELK